MSYYFLFWLHYHSYKHNQHTYSKTNKKTKIQKLLDFKWGKKTHL